MSSSIVQDMIQVIRRTVLELATFVLEGNSSASQESGISGLVNRMTG